MPGFYSDEERTAWLIAEQLMAKGRAIMRQAESALEASRRVRRSTGSGAPGAVSAPATP